MALNVFTPQVSIGLVGGNVPVFLDLKCTQRASVFDINGNALLGNAIVIPQSGVPPVFQCSATTVYFKHSNGASVGLTSAGASTVTKTDGTALPNLELRAVGI
jgi:hypothetical protein